MQKTSLQSYTKLKSKLSLNLGYLNRALNNPAQELGFKALLNLCIIIHQIT